MPIIRCTTTENGKTKYGYKVENTNGCPYTYTPGNEDSRRSAYQAAQKQLAAIEISKGGALSIPEEVLQTVKSGLKERSEKGRGGEIITELSIAQDMAATSVLHKDKIAYLKERLEFRSKRTSSLTNSITFQMLGGHPALAWLSQLDLVESTQSF